MPCCNRRNPLAGLARRSDDGGSRLQGFCFRDRYHSTGTRKNSVGNHQMAETETLKVLGTPEMKEKLYQAGFQVRAKGANAAWARVTKEITMFKEIIDQAGIQKL